MDWNNFRVNKRLNALSSSDIEKAYTLIAEIDAVKNSWHITKRLSPQIIQRLTQSVIITSTGASNRIEGNRLTDEEVEALYKNMRIKKLKTRDDQEVVGYMEFSRKDAVEALGFPERTIESIIKKLVAMKRLQRLGEGKATRYKVIPLG